jgi:hypothetical protein
MEVRDAVSLITIKDWWRLRSHPGDAITEGVVVKEPPN